MEHNVTLGSSLLTWTVLFCPHSSLEIHWSLFFVGFKYSICKLQNKLCNNLACSFSPNSPHQDGGRNCQDRAPRFCSRTALWWLGLGSPPFPYQMKSATEGNWLLQIARDRKQLWETGSGEGNQRISSRSSLVTACPPPSHLLPCDSELFSPPPAPPILFLGPGIWAERDCRRHQGQHGQVFQSILDISRDGNFAASPRNQLHFAFYPAEICLLQLSPPAHMGLSPSLTQPFRCLSLQADTPGEVLIQAWVSQKLTNPKGIRRGTQAGRKCWNNAVNGPFPCQADMSVLPDVYHNLDILPFPLPVCPVSSGKRFFPIQLTLLIFAK